MSEMVLIAGLGNPGENYSGNRHNVGFMVIDALCDYFNCSLTVQKGKVAHTRIKPDFLEDTELLLVKPLSFLNLSGE